ncbi:MAG: glycosyltransferase family 39 protein [Phycisphaerae bacterium]|nr:glycosyltransferase family 39 protein [Phycisphaerae bacterium]
MDAQSPMPDLSVVVPTLNEGPNVDLLLAGLFRAFREEGREIEVLFADGGSTDGTREKVQAWTDRAPVRLVDARSGCGLAGDVLIAAREGRAEVVLVMDGDLSHDPQAAPDVARPVIEGQRDMVIGSRYVPGGTTPGWSWPRRAMSRMARALVWPLTDVRDPTSGFFAIRRDRLLAVGDDAEGFKIALETLLRNDESLRVGEVPICFASRSSGQSKMSPRQAVCYLRRVIALTGATAAAVTARRFVPLALAGLVLDVGVLQVLHRLAGSLAVSHIVSCLLAMVVVYQLTSRWAFRPATGGRRDAGAALRFVPVCLVTLFLRGGLLAMLTERAGWLPWQAVAGAGAVSAVLAYVGMAFFVFRRDDGTPAFLSRRLAAVGWIGAALLLRLAYLGLPDLLPEEAYYWNYAQHPALSYLDHPPMVAWLIGLGTAAFGDTEFGVRIGTFLCWFVTAGFCFATARDLFGKGVALQTVALAAVLPFFFVFGFFATPDAPLTAAWAGTLFFLQRALLADQERAWWGAGICLGLGMLSKYTIILLGPAVLLFLALDRPSRRWLRRPEPYLAALVATILLTPVIVWNLRNDWVSFFFQTTGRLNRPSEFGLPLLVASVLLLVTPLGALDAFRALFSSRAERRASGVSPATTRQRLFMAVFTLVPLSVFAVFSLRHAVRLNWTGPIWLAALPGIAAWISRPSSAAGRRSETITQQVWAFTPAVLVLSFGAFFHYLAIGLPGLGIDRDMGLPMAWEEIGRDVESLAQQMERDHGVAPLVVGIDRYGLASELAFYRRAGKKGVEQTCGRHLFGGNALMYFFWFKPEEQAGRLMLLVSLDRGDLDRPNIVRWVRLDPIQERIVHKHGLEARYFCRVAYDYRPPPPQDRPDSFPLRRVMSQETALPVDGACRRLPCYAASR